MSWNFCLEKVFRPWNCRGRFAIPILGVSLALGENLPFLRSEANFNPRGPKM